MSITKHNPLIQTFGDQQIFPSEKAVPLPGLSKREFFAAQIMSGLMASEPEAAYGGMAVRAVVAADALIDALNAK